MMRSIVEKFRTALMPSGTKISTADLELEFIKNRRSVYRELAASKEAGTVVGITSPALGDGMFITAVDDIYTTEAGAIVQLKPYDMSGHFLTRTQLSLSEIRSVCPFKTAYRNPYFD